MTQQAVRALQLTQAGYQGQTAVVLGCPGGRVRVLLPGSLRTNNTTIHQLGDLYSSPDLGFGGSALAVRHDVVAGQDVVRIWFGTVSDPLRSPQDYANATGQLGDADVATGGVHRLEWRPPGGSGNGFTIVSQKSLHPDGNYPRGAYGVVGLVVGDLLVDPQYAGDELVVSTLSGDLIVYEADSMLEIWRTHVVGAAGMHSAIAIEDLAPAGTPDGVPELYVACSWGLWRFTQ